MQNFCKKKKKKEQIRGEKQSKKTGERKRNIMNLVSNTFLRSLFFLTHTNIFKQLLHTKQREAFL